MNLQQLGWAIPLSVLAITAAAGSSPPAAAFSSAQHCTGVEGYAAAFDGRRTFTLRPAELTAIKAALPTDAKAKAALADLLKRADAALARKSGSVLDKSMIAPSGDRRDYISLAPYWWPDPANPAGPYIRRDGEVNPERNTDRFDRMALGRMASDADVLGLAYYYTGDRRYADQLAAIVRTWFLDPATAMNPNMNYAQMVPGHSTGRPEGVLDTAAFIGVIDAVGLAGPSGALSADEVKALEGWFSRYLDWMLSSANGKGEGAKNNNHGIWYDAQVSRFALFARRPDLARKIVADFPARRIAAQIEPSGAMPEELSRTRSFHYSIYAIDPAYHVADTAACLGVDLYGWSDSKGRSLRAATNFVAGYRDRAKDWPHKELKWPTADLDALLLRADVAWPGVWQRRGEGDVVLRYRVE
ncbi:MAG: alginate lyase family protein [Sphingomonas sp.]|uniref:alginate lyase family protein n=1 Tax=Sphingomonas sp. TaxID=28214 RepID=UPI002634E80B|nr:alginate lyase family protein [Sphingomonas sp.]MDK2766423.1 alginate lyase family protein [Sphingomonas sp.]